MLKYGTSKTCKEKYILPELKVNQMQIPESFKLKQSKFHTVSARALPTQQNSKGFSNNDWSASTDTWTLSLLESLNDFWSVDEKETEALRQLKGSILHKRFNIQE